MQDSTTLGIQLIMIRHPSIHSGVENEVTFQFGKAFVAEEKAAEVTELGIVLALIVVLSIAFIKGIGNAVSMPTAVPAPVLVPKLAERKAH